MKVETMKKKVVELGRRFDKNYPGLIDQEFQTIELIRQRKLGYISMGLEMYLPQNDKDAAAFIAGFKAASEVEAITKMGTR